MLSDLLGLAKECGILLGIGVTVVVSPFGGS